MRFKRLSKKYSRHSDKFTASDRNGFTLVELLVASSIFLILISLAAGAFINTLRTSRVISDLAESMSNSSFVLEQIAREVRFGFDFQPTSGEIDTLTFTNSDGELVSYTLITSGSYAGIGRCVGIGCRNHELITSPDVYIENFKFILFGTERGDGFPPRVTILITVRGEKDIRVNLQTTISSRIIDT